MYFQLEARSVYKQWIQLAIVIKIRIRQRNEYFHIKDHQSDEMLCHVTRKVEQTGRPE